MSTPADQGSGGGIEDPALGDLMDELARRLQAGETVDVEAVIRDHPDHAEPLRRLLPAAQVLAELGQSLASGDVPVLPAEAWPEPERSLVEGTRR